MQSREIEVFNVGIIEIVGVSSVIVCQLDSRFVYTNYVKQL